MTANNLPNVLIVGAGPTGLTFALSLLQNGLSVRIIDMAEHPHVGQRGAALQPRGLELYNLLGVLPDIIQNSKSFHALAYYEMSAGSKPFRFLQSEPLKPSSDIPYPNVVMIGQDNNEAVLRRHLEEHYKIRPEYNTVLRSFEQNEDAVMVHLIKTRIGVELVDKEERLNVKWLIGADGANGLVRKFAGLSFHGETLSDYRFIVGDMHLSNDLNREYSHQWGNLTEEGIGLRPSEHSHDTLFQYIIGGSKVDVDKLLSDRQVLLDYMANGTGNESLSSGELVTVEDWRLNVRMANKFSEGRVFIAGDAAHIHCTSGGQGITSCVQDSMNLGWKLALVERGLAPRSLLSTYTEERLPVIQEMLPITTRLFKNIVVDKTPGFPGVPDLRQFGVNYRWSSIVVDDSHDSKAGSPQPTVTAYGAGRGDVHAGDRAPDAYGLINIKTGDATSIFKILNCFQHTAFVFTESTDKASPMIDILNKCPPNTFQQVVVLLRNSLELESKSISTYSVLEDRYGHAYHNYQINKEVEVVAIVVRPDGIVGAFTSSTEGLKKYIGLIFI